MSIHARVLNGRLQLDVPTTLPEGTVLDLVLDEEGDAHASSTPETWSTVW
jgi:hypothetical protein